MFLSAKRRKLEETIDRLYGAIVAQAREPIFYRSFGVPDTIEGRFDMLILHIHLLFRRLNAAGESGRAVGQAVFDHFVSDMDASLREIGIGDLSVPKRMRAMGEAFYGRAAVYDAALADSNVEVLAGALLKNIYSNDDGARPNAGRLAAYVRAAAASLDAQDAARIVEGGVNFPLPESA